MSNLMVAWLVNVYLYSDARKLSVRVVRIDEQLLITVAVELEKRTDFYFFFDNSHALFERSSMSFYTSVTTEFVS